LFEDVVGQDHVTRTLENAIAAKRLAHAYLFVGPRGIGKTSIARIFARALNCEKGPTAQPCGTCDSCREIAAGTNLDVLEIDGASNNGVEQVRDLRETARYAPTRGPFKIYIIDEVHMLSTAAFNALLKTLEEPPKHVKFIFATTEPQKVLATVMSRCQRFDLRRIPVTLIVERLRLMAKAENVAVDDEALLAVARGAEGGLRDAQSALDQLIAFRGESIKEEDVLAVFGLVSRANLEALADAILGGDLKRVLGLVAELDAGGKDLQRLVVELMEHFRNLLVFLNVDEPSAHMELTDAQLEALRAQAARAETGRVLRVVQLLVETEDRMKFALSRRTLLETTLIRAARAATVVSLEEVLRQIQTLQAGAEGRADESDRSDKSDPAEKVPAVHEAAAPRYAPAAAEPAAAPAPAAAPVAAPAPAAAAPADHAGDLRRLVGEWGEVVRKMAKKAVLARGVLSNVRPVGVDANKVVLGYDREFAEEIERFERGRDRLALELTLGAVVRRTVRVEFVAVEGALDVAAANAVAASAEAANAEAGGGEPAGGGGQAPRAGKRSRQELAQDPTVRKALETFGGTIIDVRE
jgi:DNA polymerase-3 subunit gamma/tau